MDINTTIQEVLKQALIEDGLARVDCMAVFNSTGKEGRCIAVDCQCEHCVRAVKCITERFAGTFEPGQLDATLKANNQVVKVKNAMLDSTLHSSMKSGGGTSFEYFREEEKFLVKTEVRKVGVLGPAANREQIKMDFRLRGAWKGLTMEKVENVVNQKSLLYNLERVRLN
jgi:hypothetical protein